jgi:hypothetical protein
MVVSTQGMTSAIGQVRTTILNGYCKNVWAPEVRELGRG